MLLLSAMANDFQLFQDLVKRVADTLQIPHEEVKDLHNKEPSSTSGAHGSLQVCDQSHKAMPPLLPELAQNDLFSSQTPWTGK